MPDPNILMAWMHELGELDPFQQCVCACARWHHFAGEHEDKIPSW
jgi:hypothetical protein